jgi:transposase
MVRLEEWMDILDLSRQGLSISEIARRTGRSRPTVRRLLHHGGPQARRHRDPPPSPLEPYQPFLLNRLRDGVLSGPRLFREVRALGFGGGLRTLQRFLQPYRALLKEVATVRFETPPGRQAQVDWGHFGVIEVEGRRRRLFGFVFTLGYSRASYAEFTTSQRLPTLQRCLLNAFAYLGGVPEEILFDNMKTVVLNREGGAIHFNPGFLDFTGHHDFTPRLCRPYRARTKGKVEAGVKYVRRHFFAGTQFTGLEDLNCQLRHWLDEVANARVHGTTGEVPWRRLAEEPLRPLPERPYAVTPAVLRQVGRDCLVTYRGNRYSVPVEYCRRPVIVQEMGEHLVISYEGEPIAQHRRCEERWRVIVDPEHFRNLRARRDQQLLLQGDLAWRGGGFNSLRLDGPLVERRPLAVYDEVAS